MFKRILKVFGIVFGVAIVGFGAVIGIMALQGKFKKPHVEPNALYFDLNYDEQLKSYYMDVTYYCDELDTKGQEKSNIYSFVLKARPDDVTELDCSMSVESGSELIDFCNKDGELLSNNEQTNIKINKPVYFKISSNFDQTTDGYNLTNGVVKLYFNSSNSLCNGYLIINIDRQVSSVSLYDYTSVDNNIHKDGKFSYERDVFEIASLSGKPENGWENYYIQKPVDWTGNTVLDSDNNEYIAVSDMGESVEFDSSKVYYTKRYNKTLNISVSANDLYPLIPIYAPENSNQPFTSVEGKTCDIYIKNGTVYENIKETTSRFITLGNDGIYYLSSSEPGDHELYLVTYPTYAIQKEAEEYFATDDSIDNIIFNNEFSITRQVIVSIKNFGIETVQFQDSAESLNISLDLFKENHLVLNNDTMGAGYTNLGVSMYNNKGFEEVSRLNQVKFFGPEDFVEGGITFTAKDAQTNADIKIVLSGSNAICSGFSEAEYNGTKNYTVSYGQNGTLLLVVLLDTNKKIEFNFETTVKEGLFKITNTSVQSTGDVNGLTFTWNGILLGKQETTSNTTYYSVGTIKVGSYFIFTEGENGKNINHKFNVETSGFSRDKVFTVTPKEYVAETQMYLFVINEDGGYVYNSAENKVNVSIETESAVLQLDNTQSLKMKYEMIDNTPTLRTSEVKAEDLVNIQSGSYKIPLLFTRETETIHTLPVVYTVNGIKYYLVGYTDSNKFVNSVKLLEGVETINTQKLYVGILKYALGAETAHDIVCKYLEDERYQTDNTENPIEINVDSVSNFYNEQPISLTVKYASKLNEEDTAFELTFVSDINESGERKLEIKEGATDNKFSVYVAEISAFKTSKLLELLKNRTQPLDWLTDDIRSANDTTLFGLGEHFNLWLTLYNEDDVAIQTGSLSMALYEDNGTPTIVYNFSNPTLDKYIKITSATLVDDKLVFNFNVENDVTDTYVGSLGGDTIRGYYFEFKFTYQEFVVTSSKMIIKSTAVTDYYVLYSGAEYSFDDYKVQYDIKWDNTNGKYVYDICLINKTDANEKIELEGISNLFGDTNCLKCNPAEYNTAEYDFTITSANEDIVGVDGKLLLLNHVGETVLTLTNNTKTSTKTYVEVKVVSTPLSLNPENTNPHTSKEISDNSLTLSRGEQTDILQYKNGNDSILNKVMLVGEKYLPIVLFDIELITKGYGIEVCDDLYFESINDAEYKTYISIIDNGYKPLKTSGNWNNIDFAESHYYYFNGVSYEKITSATKYVLVEDKPLDWNDIDFANADYYIYDGNEYTKITNAEEWENGKVYLNKSTWEEGKIYKRYNTVASLRLYKTSDAYQWRLEREPDYVLENLQFTLTANTIIGSTSMDLTYISAVKIEKNKNNPMVQDKVVTYYAGTILQLTSLVTNENVETLFKLTNNTGDLETQFKLQYKDDTTWVELTSGTDLILNGNNTTALEKNEPIDFRIFYNDYKTYEFQIKVVENLIAQTTTNDKENSLDNPELLEWSTSEPKINLAEKIKYYEYDTTKTLYDYTANLSEVESDIDYTLIDTDKDYKDILRVSGSNLSLGWVQYAGSKTYAVELRALGNDKTIIVTYYVEVISDFKIIQIKDLPDLEAHEEITFDVNEYFKIKNGEIEIPISNCIFSDCRFYYDHQNSKLIYNSSKGGNLNVNITFTTSYGNITAVDENGNNVEYPISVEDYKLKLKSDQYLVGNGQAGTNFVDLFNFDPALIESITVGTSDSKVEQSGEWDITVSKVLLNKPADWESSFANYYKYENGKLSTVQSADEWEDGKIYSCTVLSLGGESSHEDYDIEFTISITYVEKYSDGNNFTTEYIVSIPVKSAYYATINYSYNDMNADLSKSPVEYYVDNATVELSNSQQYDIVLSNETVDLINKFTIYQTSNTHIKYEQKLDTIALVAGIGFNLIDSNKVLIDGTKVKIGNLTNEGYLIFKLSSTDDIKASCYYVLKVTPQIISTNENYSTVLTDNERKLVEIEHTVDGTHDDIDKIITLEKISQNSGINQTFLELSTIKYYLTAVDGENSTYKNLGDSIDIVLEPDNPAIITIDVVVLYDTRAVHVVTYKVTLLPNVSVEIAESLSNVAISKNSDKYFDYNMEVNYSYDSSNDIVLNNLFEFTGNVGSLNSAEISNKSANYNDDYITLSGAYPETTLTLKKNIYFDVTFDLTLTYDSGLNIVLHVTFKQFYNSDAEKRTILGWNGSGFDYEVALSEFVGGYVGDISYGLDGGELKANNGADPNFNEDTIIDFSDDVDTTNEITKYLTVKLTGIVGKPEYTFTIIIKPSIDIVKVKGADENDSIETEIADDERYSLIKVDIKPVEKDGLIVAYTIKIKDSAQEYATINVKEGSKLTYQFKSLAGVDMNGFISDRAEIVFSSTSTTSTNINFIPCAENYKGKLILQVQNESGNIYNPIELYISVSKTYNVESVNYKLSSEDNESFAVGDDIDITTFINGGRYDYVQLDSSDTWVANAYYYYDSSVKKHGMVNADYLFNKYRSILYIDDNNGSIRKVNNSEGYKSEGVYYYDSDGNNLTGIFEKELFARSPIDYYKKVDRSYVDIPIERYLPLTDAKAWIENTFYRYNSDSKAYETLDESTYNSTPLNQVYEKVEVTLNGKRIVTKVGESETDLTGMFTGDTLNNLKVEAYYSSLDGYVLDGNNKYMSFESGKIYFTGEGDIKLKIYNDTGVNIDYYVNIKNKSSYVDNITLNNAVGGTVDVEYRSTTLSELKKGYTLATLTYQPSIENVFMLYLYGIDKTNFIGVNTGVIKDTSNSVTLTYEFNGYNLILKTDVDALTADMVDIDLYMITQNGIAKTIRLYITDINVNQNDLKDLTVYANDVNGVDLSEKGLWISNGDDNNDSQITKDGDAISYNNGNSAGYVLTYTGAYNKTSGKTYSATNRELINVASLESDEFTVRGVSEQTIVTLYYELKYDGVLVKKINIDIIINNNIIIGGEGFEEYDNSFNTNIYLNYYDFTEGKTTVDLIKNTGGRYITYTDLNLTNSLVLDGSANNYVANYLKFDIVSDSIEGEDYEISADGKLTVSQDKNGLVEIKVTAQYSPTYYRIFRLNIKSTIDVYQRVPNTHYDDNAYESGDSVNLLSTDLNKTNAAPAMFILSEYKYENGVDTLTELESIPTVTYKYAIRSSLTEEITWGSDPAGSNITVGDNDLEVNLPTVPMSDTTSYIVTYQISFTTRGTTQYYVCNYLVKNPANLVLTEKYLEKNIVVGQDDVVDGSKLYLFNSSYPASSTTKSLFTSSNDIMKDENVKVKFVISADDNNDAKEVYFEITETGESYHIDLSSGKDASGQPVSTLFSNSMTFTLQFVNETNVLYKIDGFTMTSNTALKPRNKLFTDLFTARELGEDLVGKSFSAVVTGNTVDVSDIGLPSGSGSVSTDPTLIKTITRDSTTFTIYSAKVTGSNSTNAFYNNSTTIYYIQTTQTKFIEISTKNDYISIVVNTAEIDETNGYTFDLSTAIKVWDRDLFAYLEEPSIDLSLVVADNNVTIGGMEITLKPDFFSSGETYYEFNITADAGITRVIPVVITIE